MPGNRNGKKAGLCGICILCLMAIIVSHAPNRSQGEPFGVIKPSPKRTLARQLDVIKVNGDLLGSLDGVQIKNLSLLVLKGGILVPIPFQVNERDRKGQYVMTAGKTARRDEDGGKLDPNDELVFLVSDAGDRLPEAGRLEGGNRIEIEITDPRYPDQRAWAYLSRYDAPPRSKVDYVRYEPATERIVSERCTVGYRKGFMFYNDLIYHKSAGGNGKDFLDRIKFRLRIDFFGGKMSIVRSEDIVTASIQGWIDGPVEVIQSTLNKVKFMEGLPGIGFDSLSEYYPQMMSSPIIVRFPFDIKKVVKIFDIKSVRMDIMGDLPGMIGGKAYTSLGLNGFIYTGHSNAERLKKVKRKGIVWGMATKRGVGTWFPRLIFPDAMYQFNSFYLTDDVTLQNPPDDVPGEIGSGVTFDLVNYPPEIQDWLGTGKFVLTFETYYASPGATPAEARKWLDIRDYPLFIDVHEKKSAITANQKTKRAGPPWECGCDGVTVDTRGRKTTLKKITYFIGGVEATARDHFLGVRVTDKSFHAIPLSKIRCLSNRYIEYDPYTGTRMAMFTELTLKNGSIIDLMSCKSCGWAGADEEGQVIYLSNAQIRRIDFHRISH